MRGSSRFIRILLVLAVGLAWTLSLTPGQAAANTKNASSATQVYTQTGVWAFNGRTWVTNCTKYSSNVDRCETKIWGTLVTYAAGKFTQKNQWVFNNLTYKQSPRSTWEPGSPLITPGEHKIDGRRWKTECNTAWTGQNSCRSQIWATVAGLKDGKYQNINMWVFNNIVHLTPLKCAVTEKALQADIKEPAVITFCLQSKVNSNWLALQYPVQDSNGAWFDSTVFYLKKSGGWSKEADGTRLAGAPLCDFYEKAGVPHDLADTVSYCFPG